MRDFKKIRDILLVDEKKCLKEALETGEHFWYRVYIRSFFAHVEGMIYKLQTHALNWNQLNSLKKISNSEEAVINQENYGLNGKGKVKKYPAYSPIDKSLRFAINIFTKVHNVEYTLDLGSDNRWNDFKNAIQIRNNVTHPEEAKDLVLTEDDVDTLMKAKDWFLEILTEIISAVNQEKLLK